MELGRRAPSALVTMTRVRKRIQDNVLFNRDLMHTALERDMFCAGYHCCALFS